MDRVTRDLHEERIAELAHLFSRDVESLPPWFRGAYRWFPEPVHLRAKRNLANAVYLDPTDILSEIERAGKNMDYATRISASLEQIGGTVLGTFGMNQQQEPLRQALIRIVEAEEKFTRDQLLMAVENEFFTPREDFVPSAGLPSARH